MPRGEVKLSSRGSIQESFRELISRSRTAKARGDNCMVNRKCTIPRLTLDVVVMLNILEIIITRPCIDVKIDIHSANIEARSRPAAPQPSFGIRHTFRIP